MVRRDLWEGADVRWLGPVTGRGGVELRPGDRAVVVDPGRRRIRSFGSLYPTAGMRPPRRRRGVTIRLPDGAVVAVARRHLEVVAPDHPLQPEPDGGHATWWIEQLEPWGRPDITVRSLVPSSFPAVVQVLHPWWGSDPEPDTWRDVAARLGAGSVAAFDATREWFTIPAADAAGLDASAGELDAGTAEALVEALGSHTSTPDDVFVAIWEGWGDVPVERFPGAARLPTEGRGHLLLRGPLRGVLESVSASALGRNAAGLWWPADRAWFVATEIEFEWTFVAGADDLAAALLADGRLEVAATSLDAPANRAAEPR